MKVDFNNLRRKLGKHFNETINTLNNPNHTEEELRDRLDHLRDDVVGIICSYEEGNPDCAVVEMDILSAFINDENEG